MKWLTWTKWSGNVSLLPSQINQEEIIISSVTIINWVHHHATWSHVCRSSVILLPLRPLRFFDTKSYVQWLRRKGRKFYGEWSLDTVSNVRWLWAVSLTSQLHFMGSRICIWALRVFVTTEIFCYMTMLGCCHNLLKHDGKYTY